MSKVEKVVICAVVGLIVAASGTAQANWSETFDGDELDLATWVFHPYPDMTNTFTNTIKTDPNGNKYLSLDETSSAGIGGSQFGAAFGSNEEFTDVRVGRWSMLPAMPPGITTACSQGPPTSLTMGR